MTHGIGERQANGVAAAALGLEGKRQDACADRHGSDQRAAVTGFRSE
jgi:hypothetical protein